MKRITLILLCCILLIISNNILAQNIKIPVGSNTDVKKFYSTTTYIVLKNEFMSDYNDAIEEAAKAFWTITPYKVIKASEFEKYRHDADKSFLMINKVWFEEDKTNTMFDFLILSLGGKYKTVNDMPTLCAIPLCYSSENGNEENYVYKLGAMIKHCQTHVNICRDNPNLTKENMASYYLKNSGSMANKKLYLLKSEVSNELHNPSNFKEVYPYNFEFTNKDEIKNLITENNDKAVISHIINPLSGSSLSFCVKIFIDTKNGFIYYYDTERLKKNADGYILPNDLKKLAQKK